MMASASHALFVCKSPLCSRKLLTQRRRDAHNPINYIFSPIIYAKGASSKKGEKQKIAKYIMPCFISFIKHWQAKNYARREKRKMNCVLALIRAIFNIIMMVEVAFDF
jgi:hypothetical protein